MMRLPKTQMLTHSVVVFLNAASKVPCICATLHRLPGFLNFYTEKSWVVKNYWVVYPKSYHISGRIKIRAQIF